MAQEEVDSVDATAYWRKLNHWFFSEGNETVTNCYQLKLTAADGKKRLTDITKFIMGKFVV